MGKENKSRNDELIRTVVDSLVNLLVGVVWVLALKHVPSEWKVFVIVAGVVILAYGFIKETSWWKNLIVVDNKRSVYYVMLL